MKHTLAQKVKGVACIELSTPFPVGPVNVYVIEGEKLTLVDVGPNSAENFEELQAGLAKAGYHLTDIEQVVLTHHHVDHVGLLDRILAVHSVPVYAHPNCRRWLRQVIETKGHAQSHLSFYRAKDQVFIGGDHILKHISSNALIEPPLEPDKPRAKSLLLYHQSLIKCAQLPIKVVLTGHGEPVEHVKKLVDERLDHAEQRAETIKEIIATGPKQGFEIVKALFPTKYELEPMLTISETVGHLDLLIERKEVVMEEKQGVWQYRLNSAR